MCYNYVINNSLDDRKLNEGQREVVEKALIDGNKLLLIQGPPGENAQLKYDFISSYLSCVGTGKSKTCVELIKRLVNLNQKEVSHDQPQGPPVLYCAPSNKAVNVGACKIRNIQLMLDYYITIPSSVIIHKVFARKFNPQYLMFH